MQAHGKALFLVASFVLAMQSNSFASTMGEDEIYYSSTALRNACLEYYPQYKTKIETGYNKWAAENQEELNKVKSTEGYSQYLNLAELIVRHAIAENEISMSELEYKCLNFYEIFSNAQSNK